jgi:hypothetical protein
MDPIIQLGWRGAVGEGAQLILNSFTLPVMEHARSSGLLSLMDDRLHLKMKTVKYSWQDKLRELMCSIVAGCEHTVSINHRLVPDTTLAKELIGKERFADQSGINRLLHAFAEENLKELEEIYRQDYMLHGAAGKLPTDQMVFVDLDMSGFRADGKTYEGAEKGYIGKRGARGYKSSFAYVHECREVLGCVFDGASASEIHHIDQLLELVKTRIGSPRVREIVLRGDAAYGKASFVDRFVEEGYIFLLRGMHSSSARKYARRIKEWVRIEKSEEELYAGEVRTRIRGSKHRIRVIVFKDVKKDGRVEFWHLLTNLPEILYPMQMMFDLYHERQGIEAFFKTDKSGLHIKNLRTRNLVGIKAFILLACITHNLIVHALASMKQVVKRGFIGVKAFVEKLACAKAWLVRRGDATILAYTSENPTVRQYINCRQGDGPTLLDYATSGYWRKT